MRSTFFLFVIFLLGACKPHSTDKLSGNSSSDSISLSSGLKSHNQDSLIILADRFLTQPPQPITLFSSPRSAGGIHDFYSEGDYWWPDPENPEGPYIRKDGQSNPENFIAHRKAMRDLNLWVSTLVAAYQVTKEEKYARHAIKHLKAFFLDKNTYMIPSLLYAQAIKGRHTGRGIGIIDTIHLIEITKAIQVLIDNEYLDTSTRQGLIAWFEDYSEWLNSHPYGIDEKNHGNNHSTWWAAQVAAFSKLTGNTYLQQVAIDQFKILLDQQMDPAGRFPEELERTKPYNYTLFNLEGYSTICYFLSNDSLDLWNYNSPDGSIEKAWQFMMPYLVDKSEWPFPPDVSHFDELPIQTIGMLLAAVGLENQRLLDIFNQLPRKKRSEEIKRNFPYWQPLLWE